MADLIVPETPIKRLFWDIETVPNIGTFWRSSRKVWLSPANILVEKRVCCICYKWEGHKRVFALTWDNGDDRDMIAKFLEIADQADELVCHNGDRFDLKWFHSQCLQYDLPAITTPKTIDTLAWARRHFYLNSNRLDYLGTLLIGTGKYKTDYELWKKVLADPMGKPLDTMVEYCRQDVRVLEGVYHKMARFASPKTHAGVLSGLSRWTCAHCASDDVRRKKRRITAKGSIQHSMMCNQCRRHYTISDIVYHEYERTKEDAGRVV